MSGVTTCRCLPTIGSSATSGAGILHDSLGGVNDAGTGIAKGHITADTQSIAGAKTFTSDLSLDGDLILSGGGDILGATNNDVRIITSGTGFTKIGTGATNHGLTNSGDLLVSGDLEVNGKLFMDGTAQVGDNTNFRS